MKRYKKAVEAQLQHVLSLATPEDWDNGLHWYQRANDQARAISERYNITVEMSAGVIACLSPGSKWGRNVVDAERMVGAYTSGLEIPQIGVYGQKNVAKALRILAGEDPMVVIPEETSPKVRAFYQCILAPSTSEAVCVDRHAKALLYNLASKRKGYASNDKLSLVKRSEYEYLAKYYRRVAEVYNVLPHQIQGTSWTTWKRLGESK